MSDLTSTSGEWWAQLLREARRWYDDHLQLPPLQRMGHDATPSPVLDQQKWSRLEKRASTMLLASLPESQREEMVAARKLSAMQILCQLLVAYQPGGLAEKELILRSLELPPEAATLGEAVIGLRRWSRWRRRALDLGVSEPDPFLLLKGLNRIVKRPLENNRDLSFRISLARSTLQVDATPTATSITQFSLHLQAELEQVAHLEGSGGRKKEVVREDRQRDGEKIKGAKVKRYAEEEEKPWRAEPKDRDGPRSPDREKPKCKFYLTDQGCRKGRECNFDHNQQDDRRRCYGCGSVEHLASACPRKSSRNELHKTKVLKEEEDGSQSSTSPQKEEKPDTSTMKELLEEANKMLKSITGAEGSEKVEKSARDEVLKTLQRQIDELKQKAMKISRLSTGSAMGLIDSGATHSLRPVRDGENIEESFRQ